MTRTELFRNLASLPHSNPQHVIPYWVWDKINESYMIFNADNGKYRFKQFITPWVRQILLAIFTECDPQFIDLVIVIPRKWNSVTLSLFGNDYVLPSKYKKNNVCNALLGHPGVRNLHTTYNQGHRCRRNGIPGITAISSHNTDLNLRTLDQKG